MKEKNQIEVIKNLDPHLCVGSRLSKLSRVFNKLYAGHLKEAGVTLSQVTILFSIAGMQPVEQREIGKFHQLERSTVTRDLERLVQRNYIKKTPNGISPTLELTKEGEAFLAVFAPLWAKAQDEALAQLGPKGQQALNTLIDILDA